MLTCISLVIILLKLWVYYCLQIGSILNLVFLKKGKVQINIWGNQHYLFKPIKWLNPEYSFNQSFPHWSMNKYYPTWYFVLLFTHWTKSFPVTRNKSDLCVYYFWLLHPILFLLLLPYIIITWRRSLAKIIQTIYWLWHDIFCFDGQNTKLHTKTTWTG